MHQVESHCANVPTLPKDIGVFCSVCKSYRGKPVPRICTSVPPVTGPDVGVMLVICGPAYVKRSAGLVALTAPLVLATTEPSPPMLPAGYKPGIASWALLRARMDKILKHWRRQKKFAFSCRNNRRSQSLEFLRRLAPDMA